MLTSVVLPEPDCPNSAVTPAPVRNDAASSNAGPRQRDIDLERHAATTRRAR